MILVICAAIGLLFIMVNLRIHRTEKIRLECLDLAIRSNEDFPIAVESVVNRAKHFEKYVRESSNDG